MGEISDAYAEVAKMVQSAHPSAVPKKGKRAGGANPKRRDFGGRVFPKASIRKLAHKANVKRISFGPVDEHGASTDAMKDAYTYIDQKIFTIMENALYDAIAIAAAAKGSGKGDRRIIKERHMIKALERHGGLGLGSIDGRKTLY